MMRKRLLAIAASVVALTSVAATDVLADVNARDDRFTVVPGSRIVISFQSLLANDRVTAPTARAVFQGLFLTRPRSNGIQFARVNRDRTITIQFRQGFTGTTSFRYGIIGEDRNGREQPRTFSRASAIFRVASPS